MRRIAALLGLVAATSIALPGPHAQAQAYPTRPIRLMVGQAPGGHTDVLARLVAQGIADMLKQPVVVENRAGAGSTIAAEIVAKSAADGYTLLLAGSNNLGLALLMVDNLKYAAHDFASIGAIARVSYGLAVHRSVPATSIAELVAYARANPGKLNYATSGHASTSALGFDLLRQTAGIDIVAIPYKGSGVAVNDFISGHVHLMFTDLSMLATLASTGSARVIAVAGSSRSPLAPNVPTVAEQGLPVLAVEPWYGLVAPTGTPADIVAKLNAALHESLRSREVRHHFEKAGYVAIPSTPAQLDEIIKREMRVLESLIDPDNRRSTDGSNR